MTDKDMFRRFLVSRMDNTLAARNKQAFGSKHRDALHSLFVTYQEVLTAYDATRQPAPEDIKESA